MHKRLLARILIGEIVISDSWHQHLNVYVCLLFLQYQILSLHIDFDWDVFFSFVFWRARSIATRFVFLFCSRQFGI